jgi:plastocyanin
MHLRPLLIPATVTTVALLALSGCGSSSNTTNSGSAPQSMTHHSKSMSPTMAMTSGHTKHHSASAQPNAIIIKNFAFSGPAAVAPGAKITVTNDDTVAHTVTADTGNTFNVNANPGSSTTFTAPTKPGSYPYHCTFHATMHGVLVVK